MGASSGVPKLGASLVRKWTEYQEEDAWVLGIGITVACVCMASGQCDEMLLFGAISLLFGVLVTCKLPELHVENTLREASAPALRTDIMAALAEKTGVHLGPDAEAIVFSVGWVITALAILLLARRTLQRYSPAACVVLYCACLSTVLRDRAADAQPVMATIVASMCALSLKSNHVLRLHIAAACFCACMLVMSEWSDPGPDEGGLKVEEVLGPLGVSLCLTVGLGACLAHDITASFLLEPAVDAAHLCYVLLATLFSVDAALELAATRLPEAQRSWLAPGHARGGGPGHAGIDVLGLRWADSLERMGRLRVSAPWSEICTYENLVAVAPPFCVFFASTMILRRVFSPKATWRRDRFKWVAAALVSVAVVAGATIWALAVDVDGAAVSRRATSPAVLTTGSSAIYLLATLVTASTKHCSIVKGKWWTMVYLRSGDDLAADAASEGGANGREHGGQGASRGGPPPFFIRGADDARVKTVAEELRKLLGTYKTLALQVERLQKATEPTGPGAAPDPRDVDELAKQQIQAADVACRAAVASEKVALQLRELASDAETERDLLVSIRKHTKANAAGSNAGKDHYMVIKRQTDNAISSFSWLRKEMEDAETQAESLMEQARRELRRAVKYYARSRLAARDKKARDELDKLMTKLTTQVDRQIMDPAQVTHHLAEAKQSARNETGRGSPATTPRINTREDPAARVAARAATARNGVAEGKASAALNPYEMAMKQKGISASEDAADADPSSVSAKFAQFVELANEEGRERGADGAASAHARSDGATAGQQGASASGAAGATASSSKQPSSSQRSKRRWWPFSSSSRSRSTANAGEAANGVAAQRSRRSLNLSNKRK